MPTKSMSVRGVPTAPRQVRAWLRALLTEAGFGGQDLAVLAASELVTNSVTHSQSREPGGQVRVRVVVTPGAYVQIEVRDDGATDWPPSFGTWRDGQLVLPDDDAESGRGLYLVARLV